jgi:hypothetical protein
MIKKIIKFINKIFFIGDELIPQKFEKSDQSKVAPIPGEGKNKCAKDPEDPHPKSNQILNKI